MNDLRKAAQQALEALNAMTEEFLALDLPYFNQAYEEGRVAITKLNAALAQPEPVYVPVAWMSTDKAWMWSNKDKIPDRWVGDVIPLYTAPPQRKPLTDQEIYKLFGWYAVPFVRAIEAAHGIGGGE